MRRYLLLTASMGSGHLAVARELQRRLVERGDDARVVDILQAMPFGLGAALRSSYSAMLRGAPWLYEAIYRSFFLPRDGLQLRADPLVLSAAPAVQRLIDQTQPDVVVSVFHLCAQIAGRLREQGQIAARSTVYVTDLVAHRMWLHAGNDAFLCMHPAVADEAAAFTGVPASAPGPVVPLAFLKNEDPDDDLRAQVRQGVGLVAQRPTVLMSAGAWGSGRVDDAVRAVVSGGNQAIVLCGRNERLRRRLVSRHGDRVAALGWRDDVAELMRACDVLVENAAGQTAMQAFAVGLPVVTFAPIPGHGRDGARRMEQFGLSQYARDETQLAVVLEELRHAGSEWRHELIAAGQALFSSDPASALATDSPAARSATARAAPAQSPRAGR